MLTLIFSAVLLAQSVETDPQAYAQRLIDGEIDPIEFDYGVLFFPVDDPERRAAWARIEAHVRELSAQSREWEDGEDPEGLLCRTTAIIRSSQIAETAASYDEYAAARVEVLGWHREFRAETAAELGEELDAGLDPVYAEVLRRVHWDQAWRFAMASYWGSTDGDPNVTGLKAVIALTEMCRTDTDNLGFVETFLEDNGWPRISEYGEEVDHGLWLMLQHAPLRLQSAWLPELERLWRYGETNPRNYAMLYDRVMSLTDRPQRYGSQYVCVDGIFQMYETEDVETVDERRLAMGMNTVEENGARFRDRSCGN